VTRWVALTHLDLEAPGLIARAATTSGVSLEVIAMPQPLPEVGDLAGLVVMGGPQAVYDREPRLDAEVTLIRAALGRNVPVLGVCLGAQLLAAAAGGAVHRGPESETGVGEITLTEDDPVLGRCGQSLTVVHWHGDTFTLPPGARHLARSDAYENQAFRLGNRTLGLQFHIEVDDRLWRQWAPLLPRNSGDEERLRRSEHQRLAILERYFEVALSRAPASSAAIQGSSSR